MPNFPIIDTHLHIWDIERLKYSAFDGHELFGRSYHIEDFQEDSAQLDIEAMVFVAVSYTHLTLPTILLV